MDSGLLVKSVVIGIAVAAPVGPMSLLCIQRTMQRGQAAGLAFGGGVAAADGTYAAIAAFGVTTVSALLLSAGGGIKLFGSLILIYVGIRIARSRPDAPAQAAVHASGWQAFATAYLLTLTNPPTILYFAGIFASLAALSSAPQAAVFSAGVVLGSMLWWFLLTTLVVRAAGLLKPPVLLWINRVSGVVLAGFGVDALVQSIGGSYGVST